MKFISTSDSFGILNRSESGIIDLNDMSGNTFWHIKDFINPTTGAVLHWEAAHDLFIDENGILSKKQILTMIKNISNS